jgi:flagellar capping protein FliD
LFSDATNGIGTNLNTFVTNTNGTSGVLATDEANMTKESTDITASIASMEARIANDKTRLTNEFVAMETAINSINTQKQFLNSTFGGTATNAAPTAASSSTG